MLRWRIGAVNFPPTGVLYLNRRVVNPEYFASTGLGNAHMLREKTTESQSGRNKEEPPGLPKRRKRSAIVSLHVFGDV